APESPPARRPAAESSRSPPRCFSGPWHEAQCFASTGFTSVAKSAAEAGPAGSQQASSATAVGRALIVSLSGGGGAEPGVPADLVGGQRAVVNGQLVQAALEGADLGGVRRNAPLLEPADEEAARGRDGPAAGCVRLRRRRADALAVHVQLHQVAGL